MAVLVPYRHWWSIAACPRCGGTYGAITDPDVSEHLTYLCWCGATKPVPRDDPDVRRVIASVEAGRSCA